jgi:hypothetical protein
MRHFLGLIAPRRRRMMRRSDTWRCVAATLMLTLATSKAWGRASADAGADVDAAEVVRAYSAVRSWVTQFTAPPVDAPESRLPIRGARAVCVILRRNGRVMGSAWDGEGDDLMVRRAAGRALADVLSNPAVSAMSDDVRTAIGPSLLVELEVAEEPRPLLGETFERMSQSLELGVHGVALRAGERWAWSFPSIMRLSNAASEVERQLPGLAAELDLATGSPGALAQVGASFYAFRTMNLVQTLPNRSPISTIAGEQVVEESSVNAASMAAFADALALHLMQRQWPEKEPLGLLGDYNPISDEYDPLIAPPLEQALAALALAQYAQAPGVNRDIAAGAGAAAVKILADLGTIDESEVSPFAHPTSCAAMLCAALELRGLASASGMNQAVPMLEEEVRRSGANLLQFYVPPDGFRAADQTGRPTVPLSAHDLALIGLSLARGLLAIGEGDSARQMTRQTIDAAWDAGPPHARVSALPWLAWAEGAHASSTNQPLAHVDWLSELRSLIDQSQLRAGSRADQRGGLALAGAGGDPVATAQTSRPASAMAWMIRRPELVPAEQRLAALGRQLGTMRFLMQLSVREECVWRYRSPDRARGGIRAATWDARQPVAGQVLALLTAVETLRTLAATDPG